ncbi:hypothetical protein BDF14DRAFT_1717038, partial [Spinellus fusiger]
HLRSQDAHILALQETHASTPSLQSQINSQFCAHSSLWTYSCGIVSSTLQVILERIPIPEDDKAILAQVSHASKYFIPFYIMVLYTLSHSSTLCSAPFSDLDNCYNRLLLMGDFNFSYAHPNSQSNAPADWHDMLKEQFVDCMTPTGSIPILAFRHNDRIMSAIDYVYASLSPTDNLVDSSVDFINPAWTDHPLLSFSLYLISPKSGRGLWRANPLLTCNKRFCQKLNTHLSNLLPLLDHSSSPQEQWEQVKSTVSGVAKSFGR